MKRKQNPIMNSPIDLYLLFCMNSITTPTVRRGRANAAMSTLNPRAEIIQAVTVVPMLAPTIIFVAVVTIISSFQVFDLIYMMTQGGPNGSTEVLVYSVYKEGFEYFEAGRSCALGYILFAVVFCFSLLARLLNREG